ncbi:MAG TPA: hypothetical protein VGN17_28495 [Bryobacteraceae bacterium]|jgi:hypothetical protein
MKKSALNGIGLLGLLFTAKALEEAMANRRQPAAPGVPPPRKRGLLGLMGRAATKTAFAVASKGIQRR